MPLLRLYFWLNVTGLNQSFCCSEAKDLENAESIQYKKTMLQRYLNDAIEVSSATTCSRGV